MNFKDEIEDEIIFYKHYSIKCNMYLYKNLKDYVDTENLYTMFKNAWNENPNLAIKILLHLRDSKNGRGEYRISYLIIYFIRKHIPEIYENVVLDLILNENTDIEVTSITQEKSEKFKNCACVVDVSDSMKRKVKHSTLPIDVSISMCMLIHESDPNNKIFSYSDTTEQVYLKSRDVESKIEEIKKIDWSNFINYDNLVDSVKNDNFKKIFILTDMDITEEDSIKLRNCTSRIIHWNLRSYKNEIKIETIGNLTKITGFTNYLMDVILTTDDLTDSSIFHKIMNNYSVKYDIPNIKI